MQEVIYGWLHDLLKQKTTINQGLIKIQSQFLGKINRYMNFRTDKNNKRKI